VRLFRRTPRAPHTRVFFATDLHGSERCFRKWLNAAAVYEAQVLVLGGDLTGKVLVPLVADSARDAAELESELARIRITGRYPIVVTAAEQAEIEADPAALDSRFQQAMEDTLRAWVELADERLAGADVEVFTMLGNDDAPGLADVLRGARRSTYAEDGIVELPGGFEMASFGYSTPTPWNTPRELAEDELAERLTEVLDRLREPARAVVNLHCPPAGTHLDQAAKLDDDMRPVVDASGLVMTSVGSTAVRAAIERYQPMLGLHGHVHESPGTERLGATLCINPGSEYGDGVLRGVIVDLEAERGVARWQLVQG
jgi:Icc-related predicted phosphoesterase